jgi:hypothetical protein
VAWQSGKLCVAQALTVDTRGDAVRAEALRRHWADVSHARLAGPRDGDLFAHNVFSVSCHDYAAIRDLQKQYFRQVRAIVARSARPEVACLLCLHLMHWSETAPGPLGPNKPPDTQPGAGLARAVGDAR